MCIRDRSTVADVLANGFFADGDWVETKDQDPDGEIRLLQLADVGDGFFRDRSSRFVNVEAAERLTVKPVEPGDVLVARMPAPLGRACICLLYTSPSPRDRTRSRMPSSA